MVKSLVRKGLAPIAAVALLAGVGWGVGGWHNSAAAANGPRASADVSAPVRLVDDPAPAKKPADLTADDLVGTWAWHGDMVAGPLHITFDGVEIMRSDKTNVISGTFLVAVGPPANVSFRVAVATRGTWKVENGNISDTVDAYSAHGFNDSDDATIKASPTFGMFLHRPPEHTTAVNAISDWKGDSFTMTSTDQSQPNLPPGVMHYTRIAK